VVEKGRWRVGRICGRLLSWAGWPGPDPTTKEMFFHLFSNEVKLVLIQKWLYLAQKIEIKYGCEEFEDRNNFSYINVPIFTMDSELKFKQASRA
jgi:hypothetical protein